MNTYTSTFLLIALVAVIIALFVVVLRTKGETKSDAPDNRRGSDKKARKGTLIRADLDADKHGQGGKMFRSIKLAARYFDCTPAFLSSVLYGQRHIPLEWGAYALTQLRSVKGTGDIEQLINYSYVWGARGMPVGRRIPWMCVLDVCEETDTIRYHPSKLKIIHCMETLEVFTNGTPEQVAAKSAEIHSKITEWIEENPNSKRVYV